MWNTSSIPYRLRSPTSRTPNRSEIASRRVKSALKALNLTYENLVILIVARYRRSATCAALR